MEIKTSERLKTIIRLSCGTLTSLIILAIINRGYPIIGHDYRYFIPRLIDTKLHLLINGPTIQWYTPSFGGGLPAYPNPQHIEYSIIQFFTLLFDPWRAVLTSTFVIALTGFMVFAQLLEKIFKFHWTSSILGAIFFIGNGFFIEHMIVGHLGYQLFPLSAILIYAALDERSSLARSAAVIALMVAMMIHQAGFYLIVILGLSFWIMLPLIHLIKLGEVNSGLALRKLLLGFILAGILAGSKIYAVMSMMQLFPRELSDFYPVGIPQSIMGVVIQLFGVMFLVPVLLLSGHDPSQLAGALGGITGSNYGIWETDTGLSPILIILLMIGLARLISLARNTKRATSSEAVAWLVLFLGIWITFEMTVAKGFLYPLIKQLPIIRSLHLNVRFAAALILPLVVLGVAEYDRRVSASSKFRFFLVAAGLALASLFSYNLLSSGVHFRIFDLTTSLQADEAIRHGERFFINHVEDVSADAVFAGHATSLTLYEPLFSGFGPNGYYLQGFDVQIRPGAVTDSEGVYFNMTNPASLVYPSQNNLKLFERIKVSERDKLREFIQRRQPDWKLPTTQIILDWVSLAAFTLTLGFMVIDTFHFARRGHFVPT
jgi:hypothetical protein